MTTAKIVPETDPDFVALRIKSLRRFIKKDPQLLTLEEKKIIFIDAASDSNFK